MRCHEVREMMSDYLESYLSDPEIELLLSHVEECEPCRSELEDLEATLQVVHALPRQEPVYDLWEEFAPKVAQIRAEVKLGWPDRARIYVIRLLGALTEGWEMFSSVIGHNARRCIGRQN